MVLRERARGGGHVRAGRRGAAGVAHRRARSRRPAPRRAAHDRTRGHRRRRMPRRRAVCRGGHRGLPDASGRPDPAPDRAGSAAVHRGPHPNDAHDGARRRTGRTDARPRGLQTVAELDDPHSARRDGLGRRRDREGEEYAQRGEHHRRIRAGRQGRRRPNLRGHRQPDGFDRSQGHASRGRHDPWASAPVDPGRRADEDSDHARDRPVYPLVHARCAHDRVQHLLLYRRHDSRHHGASDHVPLRVHPRHADGHGRRPQRRRAPGHPGQRHRRPGGRRASERHRLRQDRHAHDGTTGRDAPGADGGRGPQADAHAFGQRGEPQQPPRRPSRRGDRARRENRDRGGARHPRGSRHGRYRPRGRRGRHDRPRSMAQGTRRGLRGLRSRPGRDGRIQRPLRGRRRKSDRLDGP